MYSVAEGPKKPDYTFTVSARKKTANVPVFKFLRQHFGQIPLARIESLFGFVEHTQLYGGRPFKRRELSDRDVMQLNHAGIGVRLPLTNHFVSRQEYEQNLGFLAKYHHKPNSVIITNDDLAGWIREDFPDYRIDASVIKNIHTLPKLNKALKIYHEVVLPMAANENQEFLKCIDTPERITLFANAGCAFTCPSKTCYVSISKMNKGEAGAKFICSQSIKDREQLGMIDFDLEPLVNLGFCSFKLLRSAPGHMTGF